MGKTKAQILEEKIRQKELDNFEGNLDVEKIKAITELLNSSIPTEAKGEGVWSSPFNDKGLDIITGKAIEIVKRL